MSRKNLWRFLIMAFVLAFSLSFAGVSFGVWNTPVRLTDNNIIDWSADVSGNNIVWSAWDGGDYEIMFYDGLSTTTLTANNLDDTYPQISGNNIAWQAGPYAQEEIVFYNGSVSTTLSAGNWRGLSPKIDGNQVVWNGQEGVGDWEIFRYDGSSVTTLTANDVDDTNPQISGNNTVWSRNDGDEEVMLSNGTTETTITNNSVSDAQPQISGNNIVWQRHDGNDYEIMLYKDSTETTLTDNSVYDGDQVISGSHVAWRTNLPGNLEVMFYNGSTPATISISPYDDVSPDISGDKVVWYAINGPTQDVYVFDGAGTHLIPTPFGQSPKISGNRLVWDATGDGDNEVYTYKFDYANPGDPGVTSAVPPKDTWTNNNLVLVNFSGGTDLISGVDGFSTEWSGSPWTLPDAVKDLEESADSALSPAQPDGDRWFHLRTRDNAGNWTSTIHYGPFKIDTTKPTALVRAPRSVIAAGLTARFRVSWRGSDSASGIKNFDVQYKTGKRGKWRRWKSGVSTLKGRFTAKAGKTYFFRGRARDKAGNLGSWSRAKRTIIN